MRPNSSPYVSEVFIAVHFSRKKNKIMYNSKGKLPVEPFFPLGKDRGWCTENTKKNKLSLLLNGSPGI
jgi:hypothetical protein